MKWPGTRGSARYASLLSIWLAIASLPAWGAQATLVLVQGEVERSPASEPAGWLAASTGDLIANGGWLRTLANGQAGLMIPDRAQIRLRQNSLLQVKTEAEAKAFTQARLQLARGRAWSQARPRQGPAEAQGAAPALVMDTPSAMLSIRGTAWEVEVDEAGNLQLVVLAGEVGVANAQGALAIGAGEAARAEPGKAPVRLVLVDPASRVQWVSSWRPDPARWGAGDAVPAVLAADVLIADGEIARAIELLEPHAAQGAGDPRATALLCRALVRLDRTEQAAVLAARGVAAHPGEIELELARAEIAVLQGDPQLAETALAAALARNPDSAEAWYVRGRIASEREDVRRARRALDTALAHDARHADAAAERAAVETFAGRLRDGAARYDELLAREPSNYVALTGRGINKLKSGRPEAALDDFLRAGLVEPRYARAWLYQGVAFHQLGETARSHEAFARAAALDPRDPIPHLLAAQVAADRLEFHRAIVAARAAQQRMPYLRSLNQLANDQKGSANLGSPIASLGLEQWAKYHADAAYSPFWGASHLFLADRYTGQFTKNAELLQGYLADPLTFGASNRHASLVPRPGHYARLDAQYIRDEFEQPGAIGVANGLFTAPLPAAYFLRSEGEQVWARGNATEADDRRATAGLGLRPRHDLALFALLADDELDSDVATPALPDATLDQNERRHDLGLGWRIDPQQHVWLKWGSGRQRSRIAGSIVAPGDAILLNRAFFTNIYQPAGTLEHHRTSSEEDDLQFRHSFAWRGADWSWGLEQAEREQEQDFAATYDRLLGGRAAQLRRHERFAPRDESGWAGARVPFGKLLLQGSITVQRQRVEHERDVAGQLLYVPAAPRRLLAEDTEDRSTTIAPRLGLRWEFAPRQQLRIVAQKWHRPAGFGTLADVDTLGIALNDRLTATGGEYERVHLQYDAELGERLFVQALAGHERIDNGLAGRQSPSFRLQVAQLEQLRATPEYFAPLDDYESDPAFPEGSVDSLGLALNWLAGERTALSMRYLVRNGDNEVFEGEHNPIPYVPQQLAVLGARWSLPGRLLLGLDATWRSERIENGIELTRRADALEVESGWSFGARAYWETADKRHRVQCVLDKLAPDGAAVVAEDRKPRMLLQYSLRF